MTLSQKILKVLERVPVPYIPQAAQLAEGIIAVVHEAHAEAAAAGLPPPTIEVLQAAVADAARVAAEPWGRIKARADVSGEIVTGGTGGD